MNTYIYHLKTDAYEASGEVDAVDEAAAEALIKEQVANPRKQSFLAGGDKPPVPEIQSLRFELKPAD